MHMVVIVLDELRLKMQRLNFVQVLLSTSLTRSVPGNDQVLTNLYRSTGKRLLLTGNLKIMQDSQRPGEVSVHRRS
jgi:hypothetical protein